MAQNCFPARPSRISTCSKPRSSASRAIAPAFGFTRFGASQNCSRPTPWDATLRSFSVPARAVRAILFDKSHASNWALGWHQDRTIAVAARAEVPGYGPWSIKAGLQHVEPPFAVIEQMRTIRIHLDPVDADNAPLLIAPGSHRMGRLPDGQIDAAVARCGTAVCKAQRGDVWIYATPIVHASAAAARPRRRRVV